MPHFITWRKALILSAVLHLMLLPGLASLSPKSMPVEDKDLIELELTDYTETVASPGDFSNIQALSSSIPSSQRPTIPKVMPSGTYGEYTSVPHTGGQAANFASSTGSSISVSTTPSSSSGYTPSYSPPSPPAAPQSVIIPPTAQKIVKPAYPEQARRQGLEGTVKLSFMVLTDGSVGNIEIIQSSGYQILDDTAVNAVRQNRFTTARDSVSGQAVEYTKYASYQFDLNN